jgi:hypothetical protein
VIDIAQQTGVHRSLLYKRYQEHTARQQQDSQVAPERLYHEH